MVSHTILFLLPTAVLICFLFLNIFRIVIDDALRSEQALSSQSVLSAENLVSHVTHASDTLNSSYVIGVRLTFQRPGPEPDTIQK